MRNVVSLQALDVLKMFFDFRRIALCLAEFSTAIISL